MFAFEKPKLRYLIPVFFAAYQALFIGLFSKVIFGPYSFFKRDIFRFYFPVWKYAVERLQEGHLPLWNPYSYFGAPFLANIQSCVLYPPILILFLPNYLWAFNFYILFHLALASLFCALWMRDCGASLSASFLSGAAFGLSGFVMSSMSLTISLSSLVYFPLILLCYRRALRSRGYFWKALCGIVLTFQYLAGDPAVFMTTIVVLVLFCVYSLIANLISASGLATVGRNIQKPVLDLAQIFFTFLGLAAFHYPLFLEYLSLSNRAHYTYELVTAWSVGLEDLISVALPYFSDVSIFFKDYWARQSWFEHYYSGIVVLFLSCLAFSPKKNNLVSYHLLLALLGIGLSLGRSSWIFSLFHYGFPFFGFIRYPARFFFLFSFAAACLAGFGFDRLMMTSADSSIKKRLPRVYILWFVLISGALLWLYFGFDQHLKPFALDYANKHLLYLTGGQRDDAAMGNIVYPVLVNIYRTALLIWFMVLICAVARYFKPKKRYLGLLVGVLLFADLVPTNIIELIVEKRFMDTSGGNPEWVKKDKEIFRVMASPGLIKKQSEPAAGTDIELWMNYINAFTPNLFLPDRIFDCLGYDSLHLRDIHKVHVAMGSLEKPDDGGLLASLNIKYLVAVKDDLGPAFQRLKTTSMGNLFVSRNYLPRAFLVKNTEVLENREDILKRIARKDFDPKLTLYLEAPFTEEGWPDRPAVENAHEGAYIIDYKPERVQMAVMSQKRQWLYFSDPYYPGWTARIDGKPVKIYKANYAFRAIQVPWGSHEVVWTYEPILFKIGSCVSCLTAVGLALFFFKRRKPIHELC